MLLASSPLGIDVRRLVVPIQYIARPTRQGLGAQKNPELAPPTRKEKKIIKPGETRAAPVGA